MKPILYVLFVAVLWLPLLQHWTHVFPEKPLSGTYVSHPMPNWTAQGWFDGSFQKQYDSFMNDTLGFHSSMVYMRNAFCFKVFKQANAQNVVVGKHNYLYETDYIEALNGGDYVGMNIIKKKVESVMTLQKRLEKQGKKLVVCLAPSKADFYPEMIPARMMKPTTDSTNYKQYSRLLKKSGVHVLDFNDWFLKNKNISKYPLYPQYGIHWSQYAIVLTTDSLISYIESLCDITLNHIIIDKYVVRKTANSQDYDLGSLLNLPKLLVSGYNLCYPQYHWTDDTTLVRPKMIAIADSYFWGPFNNGLLNNCFTGSFWYYNHTVYPESFTKETIVSDLNVKRELYEADVVLLMMTTPSLKKFSWGLLEEYAEP